MSANAMFALAAALTVAAAVRGMWSPCGLSMLSQLNPVAERARGNRFWLTCVWYVAGAAVGGLLLGGVCALGAAVYGALPIGSAAGWWVAVGAALAAALSDANIVRFRLPDHPRQVDERWLITYRRWIYAGGYGVQIGTGFATYIMSAAVYLVAALAILTGSPRSALLVGLEFGLVRGLGVLLTVGVRTPAGLRRLMGRIDAMAGTSLRLAGTSCAAVAGIAAAELAGPIAGAGVAAVLAAAVYSPSERHSRLRSSATYSSGAPADSAASAISPIWRAEGVPPSY